MNFEDVIDGIVAREQGYVDNPNDRGGPTNYGITIAVARKNGYQGDMKEMPLALAREIYRRRYIAEPKFDLVWLCDESIGNELIDTGVNMGPSRAAEMLQRWLNGFNKRGSQYADVFVDGRLGDVSLDALRAFLRWRGSEGSRVMVCALNCTQGARYLDLAEGDDRQEDFLYGWIRSRVLQGAMS
jgi:lysozyme family protein